MQGTPQSPMNKSAPDINAPRACRHCGALITDVLYARERDEYCCAVVDTLDAITSDRPYRKALPFEAARDEVLRQSGTQFDPRAVEIFVTEETTLRAMVDLKCSAPAVRTYPANSTPRSASRRKRFALSPTDNEIANGHRSGLWHDSK